MNSVPTKKKGSKNQNVKKLNAPNVMKPLDQMQLWESIYNGIIPEKLSANIMMKPFGKIWKLEKHAETTKFKCDDCGKEFLIQ